MRSSLKVKVSDNKKISVYRWLSTSIKSKAIIHIVHGLEEDILKYDEFANELSKAGFVIYGHNQRLYKSVKEFEENYNLKNQKDVFKRMVKDIHELIEIEKCENNNLKVYLLGYGMGSYIIQRFIQVYGYTIDGAILCSSGISKICNNFLMSIYKIDSLLFGENHINKVFNNICLKYLNKNFNQSKNKYAWITDNDIELNKYDECRFQYTSKFYYTFLKGIKSIYNKQNLQKIPEDMPIYILGGKCDSAINFGKNIIRLYNLLNNNYGGEIKYKIYENSRHEILNASNICEVKEDIILWINNNIEISNKKYRETQYNKEQLQELLNFSIK